MNRARHLLVAALAAATLLAGCADVSEGVPVPDTLMAALRGRDDVTTLVQLVEQAGLEDLLNRPERQTLFAPSDEAFAALPDEVLAVYREDPEALRRMLRSHLVRGWFRAEELPSVAGLANLAGEPIDVEDTGRSIRVEGADVVAPDVGIGGDTVHVIDTVLFVPPEPEAGR